MNGQGFQVYSGLKNVNSETASKILDRLNSFNSAEEIASVVATYAGQRVLSIRIAQRILGTKEELGRFQELKQVAAVPGIGTKRITSIINALGDPV
jgi:phosphomevalonate kinase